MCNGYVCIHGTRSMQMHSWGPPDSRLNAQLASRVETEFEKMSAMGATFVTSSGDDGVAGRKARGGTQYCGFNPQYPASSAFVTTVGGTFGPEYRQAERTCESDVPGMPGTVRFATVFNSRAASCWSRFY